MRKKYYIILGLILIVSTLVGENFSNKTEDTATTTVPTKIISEQVHNNLPANINVSWKTYFENTDFDGDGVLYIYDQYLGRDDATIDFAAKTGGVYHNMDAEVSNFDPIDVTDTASDTIVSKIFSGLVQYVPGTTDPMPDVAVAWEVDAEGLVYLFYLREGLTFTNGEALTAEDIVFSWDRLANPVYASARINFLTDYVDSYEAVSDYVFKITLKNSFTPFLTVMTCSCFNILPKDYVSSLEFVGGTAEEGVQKNWIDSPVGSGPWMLKEYVSGDHITLRANTNYWAGRPYVDEIRTKFIWEEDTIVQTWKAEHIDICSVPDTYWGEFNDIYKDNLVTTSELGTFAICFNCKTWPFKNITIRQAVTCGMERTSVVDTLFSGKYMPAHGSLPPGIFGFSQELYDGYAWTYNPDKAKQILDDAGIIDTDGDGYREYQGKKLKIELSSYVSNTYKESATVWIENLKEIGIEMIYQQYNFYTLIQMENEGTYTLLTTGWIADYPDPENFFMLFETEHIPNPNSTRYSDPQVDAWIDNLKTNPNIEERRQLAYNIEQKIQEDCPMVWFFYSKKTVAIHDWLHNYVSGAMGAHVEKQLNMWVDADRRTF